jgi:hypothetical protein
LFNNSQSGQVFNAAGARRLSGPLRHLWLCFILCAQARAKNGGAITMNSADDSESIWKDCKEAVKIRFCGMELTVTRLSAFEMLKQGKITHDDIIEEKQP